MVAGGALVPGPCSRCGLRPGWSQGQEQTPRRVSRGHRDGWDLENLLQNASGVGRRLSFGVNSELDVKTWQTVAFLELHSLTPKGKSPAALGGFTDKERRSCPPRARPGPEDFPLRPPGKGINLLLAGDKRKIHQGGARIQAEMPGTCFPQPGLQRTLNPLSCSADPSTPGRTRGLYPGRWKPGWCFSPRLQSPRGKPGAEHPPEVPIPSTACRGCVTRMATCSGNRSRPGLVPSPWPPHGGLGPLTLQGDTGRQPRPPEKFTQ